jgi:hypothetical protein
MEQQQAQYLGQALPGSPWVITKLNGNGNKPNIEAEPYQAHHGLPPNQMGMATSLVDTKGEPY